MLPGQKKTRLTPEFFVPRTGLEPACLAALPPQGSVSAIPPPGHRCIGEKVGFKLRDASVLCLEFLIRKYVFKFAKIELNAGQTLLNIFHLSL